MNTKSFHPTGFAGLVLSAAMIPLLIGCVAEPSRSRVRVHAPTVYVATEVIREDDYVYYPGYEVYYSNNRRQFVYRDGRSWVTRPAPPRVAIDVLFASPSVRVDFRDAPEHHHTDMVRRYPRHWRQSDDRHYNRYEDRKNERN